MNNVCAGMLPGKARHRFHHRVVCCFLSLINLITARISGLRGQIYFHLLDNMRTFSFESTCGYPTRHSAANSLGHSPSFLNSSLTTVLPLSPLLQSVEGACAIRGKPRLLRGSGNGFAGKEVGRIRCQAVCPCSTGCLLDTNCWPPSPMWAVTFTS